MLRSVRPNTHIDAPGRACASSRMRAAIMLRDAAQCSPLLETRRARRLRDAPQHQGCSSCRRDADINAIVAHLDVDRPQAILRVAAVAAGLDVEFPAVPGTDDVALLGEPKAAAGLIRPQLFLDARDHLALTDRTAVMRAMILVGVETIALAKNPELERVDPQHAVAPFRELAELAHHDLVHRFTPVVLTAQSRSPQRYHICRSKKLRSAARMMAQIAVTASVALTGRSPNGASSRARSSDLAL